MSLLVSYIYTVVSVGFKGSSVEDSYCGGTILNENTILSAEDCFGGQWILGKPIKGGSISAGILHFEDARWMGYNSEYEDGSQHIDIKEVHRAPGSIG